MKFTRKTAIPSQHLYLEVNMDVISEDVHSEELAGADLAGVLLITVGQQVFIHITSAGEHLCIHRALVWTGVDSLKVSLP